MKKYLIVLALVFLSSCKKGDYNYIIYMKDGTQVKAWNVNSDGGGLNVSSEWGNPTYYYLSSSEYKKAVYVGTRNDNVDNENQ